jgi:hypothetical protein
VRLENSSVRREAQHKQKNILDDGNENKVCDLKEEGRYLLAKNEPAIIFFTAKLA